LYGVRKQICTPCNTPVTPCNKLYCYTHHHIHRRRTTHAAKRSKFVRPNASCFVCVGSAVDDSKCTNDGFFIAQTGRSRQKIEFSRETFFKSTQQGCRLFFWLPPLPSPHPPPTPSESRSTSSCYSLPLGGEEEGLCAKYELFPLGWGASPEKDAEDLPNASHCLGGVGSCWELYPDMGNE